MSTDPDKPAENVPEDALRHIPQPNLPSGPEAESAKSIETPIEPGDANAQPV